METMNRVAKLCLSVCVLDTQVLVIKQNNLLYEAPDTPLPGVCLQHIAAKPFSLKRYDETIYEPSVARVHGGRGCNSHKISNINQEHPI
jgi:hypothetical protein